MRQLECHRSSVYTFRIYVNKHTIAWMRCFIHSSGNNYVVLISVFNKLP